MLVTSIDNFYLTDEELADSPSARDGIDSETETSQRIYGAQLIQEASSLLRCQQAVACTGQVLLQRFYCKRSIKEFNVKVRRGRLTARTFRRSGRRSRPFPRTRTQRMAAAALYLAIKLEECTKIRIRDVALVFDRVLKRHEGCPPDVTPPVLEPGTKVCSSMRVGGGG
jgi:hypothetical protein